MITFHPITVTDKQPFEAYLLDGINRGCGYTFANLFLWGQQNAAVYKDFLVLFSCFHCRRMYPFPVGKGEIKPVLDAIIADASERGIPCRLIGVSPEAWQTLETLYPGQFILHKDRNSHDYVYEIDALADLKGRKYHGKRNHYNKFRETHPDYYVTPLTDTLVPNVRDFLNTWFQERLLEAPDSDFALEQEALEKALLHYKRLELETLVLMEGDTVLAFTVGSKSTPDTFDVHFEKAAAGVNGAYTAINCEFAAYLREKHPETKYLNREEDMGIEGLRKAKLSYHPHHMVEKDWAILKEDAYDH